MRSESKIPHYGGQALIEGVLMRGKNYAVAAMRKPDGNIHVEQEKLEGIYKTGLSNIPFIRGLIILWDSLYLGMKFLSISANLQTEDDEKIEGFFDICDKRGLTGDQGVLIPKANVKHLMLRQDVIDAVEEGKFHIYPVEHIDEGIEILTGIKTGKKNDE